MTVEPIDPQQLITHALGDPAGWGPEHLSTALRAAAELIRAANHATRPERAAASVEYVSEAGDAAAALAELAARLPQLCEQLVNRVNEIGGEVELYHDGHGQAPHDPAVALGRATDELRRAGKEAERTAERFSAAHNALARLGHPD